MAVRRVTFGIVINPNQNVDNRERNRRYTTCAHYYTTYTHTILLNVGISAASRAILLTASQSMAWGVFPPFQRCVGKAVVPKDTTIPEDPAMTDRS